MIRAPELSGLMFQGMDFMSCIDADTSHCGKPAFAWSPGEPVDLYLIWVTSDQCCSDIYVFDTGADYYHNHVFDGYDHPHTWRYTADTVFAISAVPEPQAWASGGGRRG